MPDDPTSDTALMVMAVAAVIQTLLFGALVAVAVLAKKLFASEIDRRYHDLVMRIDETARPMRQAAESVQAMSDRASAAMDQADRLAGTARTWLAIPRSLLTVGLATVASLALGKWRRRRHEGADAPERASTRAIH